MVMLVGDLIEVILVIEVVLVVGDLIVVTVQVAGLIGMMLDRGKSVAVALEVPVSTLDVILAVPLCLAGQSQFCSVLAFLSPLVQF